MGRSVCGSVGESVGRWVLLSIRHFIPLPTHAFIIATYLPTYVPTHPPTAQSRKILTGAVWCVHTESDYSLRSGSIINPLTPGAFCKTMHFLDILVAFTLDLGQISFNPVENAFATQQLASLATRIAFYHIDSGMCRNQK